MNEFAFWVVWGLIGVYGLLCVILLFYKVWKER